MYLGLILFGIFILFILIGIPKSKTPEQKARENQQIVVALKARGTTLTTEEILEMLQ